jgi:fructose-bisphosphate aldolase class II
MFYRPRNLYVLKHLLEKGEKGGYAVGAFSPRCSPVIKSIFWAGQRTQSPIIVQICQPELNWYKMTMAQFAQEFWDLFAKEQPTVPVGLHLDHTQDIELVKEAISYGFTSVMIDASTRPIAENIALSGEVVEYAHSRGISVEAELGKIGSADMVETQTDEELFTDPQEAEQFVKTTGVDALAVSVGTAHGVYTVHQPRVDVERIKAIRALTAVHLVLHGGSGTPKELIYPAIHLPGGGISKINVATDLELALLKALGIKERMSNEELKAVPEEKLKAALEAVEKVVEDKIVNFLGSQKHAADF